MKLNLQFYEDKINCDECEQLSHEPVRTNVRPLGVATSRIWFIDGAYAISREADAQLEERNVVWTSKEKGGPATHRFSSDRVIVAIVPREP
ncbi:hypothetical protein Aduo_005773 [Ancylostoma duodenale]